jgi:hypothetical protein
MPREIGNIWRTELLGPRQLLCKERSGSAARRSGHLLSGSPPRCCRRQRLHQAPRRSPNRPGPPRISCSIITTVLPASTRRCNCTSSRSASDACRPVVGSSSTYSVRPRWLRCSSVASLMRCASPPESSVAGCPAQVAQSDIRSSCSGRATRLHPRRIRWPRPRSSAAPRRCCAVPLHLQRGPL